ncbi:5,6-dimethylbenzimidazole synthase [Ancylobacter amanitiformis]|uniref:5,6-dimethylbenzimidazole synthase n=1 Tax=Ancylobacter amanitiformis TaxID=217069 RepID=A0ABU0LMV8_9HYPH|nr:5,6-dimethylbenzimidazole synthase [Ancylobacter amanitiformis]MDQ0509938.1 5,6-dimethylbenzimidazole synthase [Ancylobacter amanitiformis]
MHAQPPKPDDAPPAPSTGSLHPPLFDAAFRARLDTLFAWRRDVRHFRPTPLAPGELAALIALAMQAPSVGLSQPWRFVRVGAPARRRAVRAIFAACNAAALADQPASRAALYARLKLAGLDEAPEHLAVFVEPDPPAGHGLGRATMPETLAYSAVMAIHTLWLAAAARGIGVGWVSILDPVAVAAALDVPAHWRLVGYLCIGYPCEPSDVPELERAGWEHRRPPADFLLER